MTTLNFEGAAHAHFSTLDQARQAARRGVIVLLAWLMARTLIRLGFLASTAALVGSLIMNQPVEPWLPATVFILLGLTAAAGLAGESVQASVETRVAIGVRTAVAKRLCAMPARRLQSLSVGAAIVGIQRHPESVATLAIGHRAASLMMALGPLMAAGALAWVSWQAAALVLALTPVMIVFFVLIGNTIRDLAAAQEKSFGRLAGQFADRIRTLPTILANHAAGAEQAKLTERMQCYAARTMSVLRIAFANAGIIDFFASLSIAMLAVFLGLGHLKLAMIPGFSNLTLWQSLFILMIAPDYFAPFRRFSEQYHAKANGMAGAAALDRLFGAEPPPQIFMPAAEYAWDLPARGLVAIVGESGSGKTTLLRRIAAVDPAPKGDSRARIATAVTWVAADSFVPEGTLQQAIMWNADAVCPTRLEHAARSVGLLDDALLPGGLAAPVMRGGTNLSGGQRLRIAVVRAALTRRPVIADEPTAKLDALTASFVRRLLCDIARTRLVLVATHDENLVALADRIIDLGARGRAIAAA